MSARGYQKIRVVAAMPAQPLVRFVAPDEWDDDPDAVDFQDETLDDTVNVAAQTLEAAVEAEKQSTKVQDTKAQDTMATEEMHGAEATATEPGSGPTRVPPERTPEAPPPFELAAMIRVAKSGVVVTNKGGSEDLAGVVAYAHRLVDLVGDLLGLEGFRALECVFKTPEGSAGGGGAAARCLLFAEDNGDTVLVRPRVEGELQALRERLGV